jgi:hypothetical protein
MPATTPAFRIRLAGIGAAVAALAWAGLGPAATGPRADAAAALPDRADPAGAPGPGCDEHGSQAARVAIQVPDVTIRDVVLCDPVRGPRAAAVAQALAVGLVIAADGPDAGRRAQVAALADLRALRARAAGDPSVAGRDGGLAAVDETIAALEKDLSEPH